MATQFGAKPTSFNFAGAAKTGTTAAAPGGFGAKPAASTTAVAGAKPASSFSFGAKPTSATTPGATSTATTTASTSTTGAPAATATTGFSRTPGGFGQTGTSTTTTTSGTSTLAVGFGGVGATAANNPEMESLKQRFNELYLRLNPENPASALKYVFYNRVDPAQVRYYRRPDKFDPGLWIQAQQLNPDPEHMVPHMASGYADLKARMDAQDAETSAQANALADAETFLRAKMEEHSLKTALKLDQLKRDSLLLSHRLLTVSAHIEILRARGLAIQPDEDAWRQQLHNILMELSKPNEYRGRLNELASRIRMQQQQQQIDLYGGALSTASANGATNAMDVSGASDVLASASESFSSEDLDHFSSFLQHQQAGIEHLIDILNSDIKNMQVLSDNLHLLKKD